jgi:hypothetical protein
MPDIPVSHLGLVVYCAHVTEAIQDDGRCILTCTHHYYVNLLRIHDGVQLHCGRNLAWRDFYASNKVNDGQICRYLESLSG